MGCSVDHKPKDYLAGSQYNNVPMGNPNITNKLSPYFDNAANVKPSNPKDSVGIKKVPLSTVPCAVLMEVGLAMLEGALKYARHNYRDAGVRGSVYYDAAMRHLMDWFEGTDIDTDSGLSHITKAIASLVVLRDGMINNKWVDDRPPKLPEGWLQDLNKKAGAIIDKYPNPKQAFTEKK